MSATATPRLAALAVALIAPAAAAAEGACTAETYTTVCRHDGRELRIIRDSISSSGEYGVAWEVPTDGSVEAWSRGGETDGSKLAGDYDGYKRKGAPVKNFLVRLADGKPIRQLAGNHIGDHSFYNHVEHEVAWSPDSGYVAILIQEKWLTLVAEVYLVAHDTASKPVSLLSICKNVTKAEAARRHRKGGENYLTGVNVSSVRDDGTVTAVCYREIPKRDDFQTGMEVKFKPVRDGLNAQVVSTRRCGDDDERGICASPPARD
jgi:hypothetical protein